MTNKQYPYTREELTKYLLRKQDELGRKPNKSDIPEKMRPYFAVLFGKWCYALEASGIVVPSDATLARRRRHKEKYRKLHKKMRERARAKKRGDETVSSTE